MPINDIFDQLLECRWRGIGFPIAHLKTKIEHDHAIHAKPDQDGARIESTGRKPITVSGHCIFRRYVVAGDAETWSDLYPDVHRDFVKACSDRSEGVFQHPVFGDMIMKVVSCESTLDGNRRDGEDCDVTWIETLKFEDDEFLAGDANGTAYFEALNLDAQLKSYMFFAKKPLPEEFARAPIVRGVPSVPEPSFADALLKITSVFDRATLLNKQLGGQIDHLSYRLENLTAAIDRHNDPQSWPTRQAIERLKAAANALKNQLFMAHKDVSLYILPKDSTLGAIAAYLKTAIGDIITLNPTLVASPVVPARTPIRYYRGR